MTDDNDTPSELKDDEIEDDPDVYWVVSKADGKIQLSATNGGAVIDLTTNSHGGAQTLSAYDGTGAQTGTAVRIGDPGGEGREIAIIDTGDDSIYVGDAAGLITGDQVVYSSNGRPVIGGLVEGATYFVIDAQDGRVRLAATLLDASNGDAIDLTSAGLDGGHTLTKGVQVIDLFAPLEVSGTKMQSTVVAASVGVAAGSNGASAAVAVSVTEARNESTGVTEALVTGSDVSGSHVSVTADAAGEISVVGVAASISAGVSSSVAVSVSVSDVVIDNLMNNTVSAEILGGGTTSSSGVSVTAEDNSKIGAVGIAASVAVSVGSSGSIAAGVSVSIVNNEVNTDLQAVLDPDSVSAGGAILVTATNQTEINSVAVAAAVSVAGGGSVAVGAAGSGVEVTTTMGNSVSAILGAGTATNLGTVTVTATDRADIDTVGVAASVSAAIGSDAGIALGISVVKSTLDVSTAVLASISAANLTSPGTVAVTARSDTDIDTVVVAASISIGGGSTVGVAGAGSIVLADADVGGTTTANITGSTITDGGIVRVNAYGPMDVTTIAVAAAIAGSFGGTGGVTVTVSVVTADVSVENAVSATIANSTITSGNLVEVKAQSVEGADRLDVTTIGVAASISVAVGGTFAVGAAGAGVDAKASLTNQTTAEISGGTVTADRITVTALDRADLETITVAVAASIAASGNASVGLSGAVALADIDYNSATRAKISGATVTQTGNLDTLVTATSDGDVETISVAAAVSIALSGTAAVTAAVGVATASTHVGTTTEALIQTGSTVITPGNLLVTASDTSVTDTFVLSAALAVSGSAYASLSISVALTFADNTYDGTVRAKIDDSTVDAEGDVSVLATSTANVEVDGIGVSVSISASAGGSIAGAAGAAVTSNTVTSLVEAAITNADTGSGQSVVADNVTVDATERSRSTPTRSRLRRGGRRHRRRSLAISAALPRTRAKAPCAP